MFFDPVLALIKPLWALIKPPSPLIKPLSPLIKPLSPLIAVWTIFKQVSQSVRQKAIIYENKESYPKSF